MKFVFNVGIKLRTYRPPIFSMLFTYSAWVSILGWLGLKGALHRKGVSHFVQFGGKEEMYDI